MAKPRPRVPLPAIIKLPGETRAIQVNHCKMPDCSNFGIPARTKHGKRGPSADRDLHYKVHSTKRGQIPSVRCKECKDNPPIKSNDSIRQEVDRLMGEDGIWTLEESTGCRNEDCDNHDRPVGFHPKEYRKRGKPKSGKGHYYECKQCGSITLVSDPVRLHENKRYAVDLLSRIANKSPLRGAVRGTRLRSFQAYYRIFDFLTRRCRSYSGAVDRALIDGRLKLPADLNVQSDAQVYQLNWISRMDRRNVELSAYATVDVDSGFILGLHCNFDGRVDPFEINTEALESGDLELPECFRKRGHYWLAGDELGAGRAMARRDENARVDLLTKIGEVYASAETRQDVENIELQVLDTTYVTPFLSTGLQVHMPYTAYAHWFLLHRVLTGAGVKKLQLNTDIDSMTRAAFFAVYADEVKRGDAHAFFVQYTKWLTIDERERIQAASKRKLGQYRTAAPGRARWSKKKLAREMMKEYIEEREKHGKWDDEWAIHPLPTINEPEKAMCWLTPRADLDENRKADLFLRSGLARIDNVFQKIRRLTSTLERPVGTSSTHNKVWHGYAPYNPTMLSKYLTVFRAVHNFVFVGDDKRTPAMRLGFAKQPLEFEDLVWPGERVPRPKRARRRGKKAIAA